jgi:hypothetical protein
VIDGSHAERTTANDGGGHGLSIHAYPHRRHTQDTHLPLYLYPFPIAITITPSCLYPPVYLKGFLGLGIHPDHRTISPPCQAGYIILQATSPPFRSICLSIFLCLINQTSQTFSQATTMTDVHLASLPRLLPCTTTITNQSQTRRPIMATSTNAALANLQPRQTHRSRSISSSTNSTPRISTSNRSTPYLRPSPTSRRRNRHLLPRQPTLSRQPSPALDTLIDSLEQSRLNTQSRTRQRARPFPPRPPTAATPAITLTSTDITATTVKPTIKSKDKMASTSTSTSMHAGPSSSQGQVRVKQEEGHVRVKQEEGCEASSSTQQQRQSQTQAQTQRIDERPRYKDPYHGHEETAKMSARFVSIMLFSITCKSPRSSISIVDLQIISLFNCPVIPPQTGPNSPQPPLAHFIAVSLVPSCSLDSQDHLSDITSRSLS